MLFWVGSSFVGWGQLQIDGTHSTAGTGFFEYTALSSAIVEITADGKTFSGKIIKK